MLAILGKILYWRFYLIQYGLLTRRSAELKHLQETNKQTLAITKLNNLNQSL